MVAWSLLSCDSVGNLTNVAYWSYDAVREVTPPRTPLGVGQRVTTESIAERGSGYGGVQVAASRRHYSANDNKIENGHSGELLAMRARLLGVFSDLQRYGTPSRVSAGIGDKLYCGSLRSHVLACELWRAGNVHYEIDT